MSQHTKFLLSLQRVPSATRSLLDLQAGEDSFSWHHNNEHSSFIRKKCYFTKYNRVIIECNFVTLASDRGFSVRQPTLIVQIVKYAW